MPVPRVERTLFTRSGGGIHQRLSGATRTRAMRRSHNLESRDPTRGCVSDGRHRPHSKPDVEWVAVSRLETLLVSLQKFYGVLSPPPRDPFTLFVWEVLSAHSTPRKRDAALAALKRIPALTPDAMWRAPQKKLHDTVALAGPYTEQRLRALRTGVDLFRRAPQLPAIVRGPLPAARRALKPLPQLG